MNSRRAPHFLCGSRLRSWRAAATAYGRLNLKITAAVCGLAPFRIWERVRYGAADRRFRLHPEPVFIIGHWQAGHSWMHQLLSLDPQFSVVRLRHCVAPAAFRTLSLPLKRLLPRRLPADRAVDSLPLGLDAPQGDDFLLAGLTQYSFYFAYVFPRAADQVFRKSLLFDDVPAAAVADWRNEYRSALTRVARAEGQPRILSRNASNTTRIAQLLEMFPEARLIHMCRHPESVYAAQARRWRSLTERWALQHADAGQLRYSTIDMFQSMMRKYLVDRAAIAPGRLMEVRYEDLRARPLDVLGQVYDQLQLGEFAPLVPRVKAVLESSPGELGGHEVRLSAEDEALVRDRWAFAFDAFGYEPGRPEEYSASER